MKMNLWIRSQDKEVLTRVVDIWKDADKNEIWSKSSFATKNCLGIYKTKERAIEVLDEIQNKINLINLGHDFGSPMIDLKNPTYIYQMPEK